jgi:holo-[acyl-carrier protein] synthase
MIVGIGVDRVSIVRIEHTLSQFSQRFIERVYTPSEYTLAQHKGVARRLAMFFAAKEAVSKALGTGFVGFSMRDIEVIYDKAGKPSIALHAGAHRQADRLNIEHIHLSLTDDDGVAMAFAVAEAVS